VLPRRLDGRERLEERVDDLLRAREAGELLHRSPFARAGNDRFDAAAENISRARMKRHLRTVGDVLRSSV